MAVRDIGKLYSREAFRAASLTDTSEEYGHVIPYVIHAAITGDAKMAREAIQGMNLSDERQWQKVGDALFHAVRHQNTQIVEIYIKALRALHPLKLQSFLNTDRILHCAADFPDVSLIRVLVEAGADPSLVDKAGYTPRMLAHYNGCDEMAQLLNVSPIDERAHLHLLLHAFCGLEDRDADSGPYRRPYQYIGDALKGSNFFPMLEGREALAGAFATAKKYESPQELFRRIQDGKLTLVSAGMLEHAIDLFFYTPPSGPYAGMLICGVCHRPEGNPKNMRLFVADRKRLTETHLIAIQNAHLSDQALRTIDYLHTVLPDELRIEQPSKEEADLQRALDDLTKRFDPKPQGHPNCTSASAKTALRGMALVMGLAQGATADELQTIYKGVKGFSNYLRQKIISDYEAAGGTDAPALAKAKQKLEKRLPPPPKPPSPVIDMQGYLNPGASLGSLFEDIT